MALDNAQFISELSITDPPGTDPLSEGDDQIRTAKRAVFQSFPFVDKQVNLTADQLNDAAIKSVVNVFTQRNDFQIFTRFADGSEAQPGIAFLGTQAHGFYRINSTSFGATVAGVLKLSFRTTDLTAAVPFLAPDGSAAAPAFGFSTSPSTGFSKPSSGVVALSIGGGETWRSSTTAFTNNFQFRNIAGSQGAPAYSFGTDPDSGMWSAGANQLNLGTGGLPAIEISSARTITLRNENTVHRINDTQSRTGWRYTDAVNNPMWAIYLGADPNNTLAFQRYNNAGAFQDIPFSIRQLNGLIRMSTLPTSSAGLISGELWRNPVSPGFVAIV